MTGPPCRPTDSQPNPPNQTKPNHIMTTQQTANDLESYLERRFERAMDRLDRNYLETEMSEYDYQNEVEMLRVQIFQGIVAVCNLENQ
jgi:hypothetical protein